MNRDLKVIYGVWIFVIASSILLLPLISSALTDNIISYYKFDEQDTTGSGTIYDALFINNGTNTGADNTTGKINTAYYYDGDDYIDITGVSSDNTWTFSVWVNQTAVSGVGGKVFDFQTGRITFQYYSNTWSVYSGADCSIDANQYLNEWHFWAVTQDGTDVRVYKDGVNVKNCTLGGASFGGTGVIGQRYSKNTDEFIGVIDDLGFWDDIKSPAQISELYAEGAGNQYPFAPADTCTCAGAGNNWEIDMSDYCNITDACDLTTGTLSFTGTGITRLNSTIKTTNLGDPGSSGVLYIQDSCLIEVS